jgi:TLC domain
MLKSTLFLHPLRYIFMRYVKKPLILFAKLIKSEKLEYTRTKGPRQLYDFVFYTFTLFWGILISVNHPAIPWYFGGLSDSYGLTLANWPNPVAFNTNNENWILKSSPFLSFTNFYMFQLGHRLLNLFELLFNLDRVDLKIVAIHHICAVYSMLLSYFSNTYDIGVLVLLCCDFTDGVLQVIRIVKNSSLLKKFYIKEMLYVILLVVWIVGRICFYGLSCMSSIFIHPFTTMHL